MTTCPLDTSFAARIIFTQWDEYDPMATPPNLDRTLIALADPTRRAILQHLSAGEARVTELAYPFAISLNSVSKHIRMLERAGLVRRRRVGREHFLSFNPKPLDAAASWVATQRAIWTARLDALDAILQAEDRAAAARKQKGRSR
jgi:DNA-binding transcriptional ArsR family regulator